MFDSTFKRDPSVGPVNRPRLRTVRRLALVLGVTVVVAACAPSQPVPGTTGSNTPRPTSSSPSAKATTFITPAPRLPIGRCQLFPQDNVFHAAIGSLPTRTDSAAVIAAMGGRNLVVRPGFSSLVWEGSRAGVPVNIVDSRSTGLTDLQGGAYAYASDLNGHPIPASPRFEGWPGIAWDRHLLIVDTATCRSSEMLNVIPPWENLLGRWRADTAVKFDLGSNYAKSGVSAMASGISMLSGMIRFDEVASGRINHVIAVSVPAIKAGPPVWPARRSDGRSNNPNAPAMGTWLRLRPGTNLSGFGPQARVVAQALKDHGAIIVDTGGHGLALSGEPAEAWNDKDLDSLRSLSAADFEVVDPTPMKISDDSHQIR